jgi:hypothetical protein
MARTIGALPRSWSSRSPLSLIAAATAVLVAADEARSAA